MLLTTASFTETVVQCCIVPARVVHATDIDQDGDTDLLASTNSNVNPLVLLENSGDGVFLDASPISFRDDGFPVEDFASRGSFNAIDTADLDGDGDIDILGATLDLRLLRNLGDGYFEEESMGNLESTATALRIGDLDGDGDLDAVSGHTEADVGTVFFHENLGDAFFDSWVIGDELRGIDSLRLADADQDGDLDVFIASAADAVFGWYENEDGAASFSPIKILDRRARAQGLAAGDFSGNGQLDIVTTSIGSISTRLHANVSNPAPFSDAVPIFQSDREISGPILLGKADFDGDGDLDLVSTYNAFDSEGFIQAVIWHENQDGNFSSAQTVYSTNQISNNIFRSLDIADFNNDGRPDIALAAGQKLVWIENEAGKGQFSEPRSTTTASSTEAKALADWDNDGDLDLLAADQSFGSLVWYDNTDGRFGDKVTVSRSVPNQSVAIDVDNDGNLDVLTFDSPRNNKRIIVEWIRNSGDGTFESPRTIANVFGTEDPVSLAVRRQDLNEASHDDILLAVDRQLLILESAVVDGNRTLLAPKDLIEPEEHPIADVLMADLNEDQIQDLVLIGAAASQMEALTRKRNWASLRTAGPENLRLPTWMATEIWMWPQLRPAKPTSFFRIRLVLPGFRTWATESLPRV